MRLHEIGVPQANRNASNATIAIAICIENGTGALFGRASRCKPTDTRRLMHP